MECDLPGTDSRYDVMTYPDVSELRPLDDVTDVKKDARVWVYPSWVVCACICVGVYNVSCCDLLTRALGALCVSVSFCV